MGLQYGNQLICKMTNVVARELDLMLDFIGTKYPSNNIPSVSSKRSIACDLSNIIHSLSHKHSGIFSSALVREVALFLKQLAADTGYTVVAVLDGNVRPQSKRDAFKRRFQSTMSKINGFYCRQAAMRIASKPKEDMTDREKSELNELNIEAKRLETSKRLNIPSTLKDELDLALEEVGGYVPDRLSGGVVSRELLQAEYESDYMIAYRIRNGKNTLLYSTDGDMAPLCGATSLCIRLFREEKYGKKKRKNGESETPVYEYEISCGSNILLHQLREHSGVEL